MNLPEPTGLIVSLPEPIIDRIFHHRDVYVHPDPAASSFLNTGDRVFFYDSISRQLIGEAVVGKMALERWDQVPQHGQHLFLTPEELEQYAHDKRMARDEPLVVLELEDAIKYMNPMKCPIPVPESGLRITREAYDEITRANR